MVPLLVIPWLKILPRKQQRAQTLLSVNIHEFLRGGQSGIVVRVLHVESFLDDRVGTFAENADDFSLAVPHND